MSHLFPFSKSQTSQMLYIFCHFWQQSDLQQLMVFTPLWPLNSPCCSGCSRSRGTDSCRHRSWLCILLAHGSTSSWGHAWSRCRASAGSSPGLSHWNTQRQTHHMHLKSHSAIQGLGRGPKVGSWENDHRSPLENQPPSQGNNYAWRAEFSPCSMR